MANYTRSEETKRSIVYTLPTPTNWAEVSKVLNAISQQLAGRNTFDDDVTVTPGDDCIRFTFDADLVGGEAATNG